MSDSITPAVTGLASSYLGSKSTKEAAKMSAAVAYLAMLEQKRQFNEQMKRYDEQKEMFMPFYETGREALGDYEKMLHGGYDMQESPAAMYELQQGTKAMNRALASRGLSGSGNAVNRITELNQSISAKDWNNQYNRLLDAIKVGTGGASGVSTTNSAMGQTGQNYANSFSNAASNLGNIYSNQANALNSIYSNAAAGINTAMNNAGNNAANMMALGTKAGWWGGESGLSAESLMGVNPY